MLYLLDWAEAGRDPQFLALSVQLHVILGQGHCLVGSSAGAAHLLKDNAGVLREAQTERKSVVEKKVKSFLDFDFQYEYKL